MRAPEASPTVFPCEQAIDQRDTSRSPCHASATMRRGHRMSAKTMIIGMQLRNRYGAQTSVWRVPHAPTNSETLARARGQGNTNVILGPLPLRVDDARKVGHSDGGVSSDPSQREPFARGSRMSSRRVRRRRHLSRRQLVNRRWAPAASLWTAPQYRVPGASLAQSSESRR